MQTYKQQFESAKKGGKVEDMTYQAFTFKERGDSVVGELVDIQETHFDKTNSTVNKYILKTDAGAVSVICGAIGDAQLDGRVKVGDILRFEYVEKKDLTGGRSANIFIINRVAGEVFDHGKADDSSITD